MMDNNKFSYTYSAETQEEIAKIREKYCPREETTLEKVRRLDKSVNDKATAVSIAMGILSSLVLGIGMCCCMVWTRFFVLGIIIGTVGIAGVCITYPIYKKILAKERAKIAPQILALTSEITEQEHLSH